MKDREFAKLTSSAFVIAAVCCAALAQEPATIRVGVRVVEVPTAVTSSDGKSMRGLQPDDFALFDNERVQKFQLDYVDGPLSLAVVIQTTDSARTWLPEVRRVASAVEALVVGENGEASVSTFNDEVKLIQPMTSDIPLIDKAFASVSVGGYERHCLDAVSSAAKVLGQTSTGHRRVVLLIAQPGDTGSSSKLRDVIEQVERNNITVYSLAMPHVGRDLVGRTVRVRGAKEASGQADTGIMASVDLGKLLPEIYKSAKAASAQDYVTILTDESGGRLMPFRKLQDLEAAISAIGEELHTEYVLSYTPDRNDRGYHRIRVQVGARVQAERGDLVVRSRPGYYVSEAEGFR